jgi:hypothetical protein
MRLHLLLVALSLVTVSCKTTKLMDTWTPKDHVGAPYERLMVVGLARSPSRRAQYENGFADRVGNRRVLAIASVNVVPELADIDGETIAGWLSEYRLDGVVVTRVTTIKPARKYVPPYLELSGWYGKWAAETVRAPRDEDFYLEVDLFDAKTEALVYSSAFETKIKDSQTETIHSVLEKLVEDMGKRGYLPGR